MLLLGQETGEGDDIGLDFAVVIGLAGAVVMTVGGHYDEGY